MTSRLLLGRLLAEAPRQSEFVAYQTSARGGVVKVRVQGDRAYLGGRAVIVAKGELLVEEDVREPERYATGTPWEPDAPAGFRPQAVTWTPVMAWKSGD